MQFQLLGRLSQENHNSMGPFSKKKKISEALSQNKNYKEVWEYSPMAEGLCDKNKALVQFPISQEKTGGEQFKYTIHSPF